VYTCPHVHSAFVQRHYVIRQITTLLTQTVLHDVNIFYFNVAHLILGFYLQNLNKILSRSYKLFSLACRHTSYLTNTLFTPCWRSTS